MISRTWTIAGYVRVYLALREFQCVPATSRLARAKFDREQTSARFADVALPLIITRCHQAQCDRL